MRGPHYRGIQFHAESILTEHGYDLIHDLVRDLRRRASRAAMATPDVVVVDHHDSYTWNLVHLVAAVTGALPTVVQHDEVAADGRAARTATWCSHPAPGHPDESRPTSRSAARCCSPPPGRCSASASACRAWSRRTAGRSTGSTRPTACWPGSRHDGAGLFAGLPDGFAAVRYHSLAALVLPVRAARDRH